MGLGRARTAALVAACLLPCSCAHTNASGEEPRSPDSEISGQLPPEVIQATVRARFGKFRTCYEAGLARNSELSGKVSARFVIGRDGTVTNVADGGSDLEDTDVRACVLKAFYDLRFPKPDGGIVVVVYPIFLAPD